MSKSDPSKGIEEPQQQVGGNAELPAPCFLQTEYTFSSFAPGGL